MYIFKTQETYLGKYPSTGPFLKFFPPPPALLTLTEVNTETELPLHAALHLAFLKSYFSSPLLAE
jgi:hypothetical protein